MHNIEDLIRKYTSGQCSPEEKAWLEQWYQSFEWNNKISGNKIERLREEVWAALQHTKADKEATIAIPPLLKQFSPVRWWLYAAATLLIGIAITFYFQKPTNKILADNHHAKKNAVIKEIMPGTSKAQLVLADGKTLTLDSSDNMQLTEEDGTRINKQSGRLVYSDITSTNNKILFNILSTPRGGEYQLVLPDGSKVWLNAASSIRFPTRFDGKDRTVFLQGEAYFEVVKNADMPFRVNLDDNVSIEVVGTHFNIMGYSDENEIKTTLVEGKVKVASQVKSVFLSHSKQAVIKKTDRSVIVSNADVEKALAWKNGMIEFDDEDLSYIMRQLSRWYNVDVSFAGNISLGKYKGAIRRKAPLSEVMEILKVAGVKFNIEGKKVIVTDG